MAPDKGTRQKLVNYYHEILKLRYAPHVRSLVYRAKSASDAENRICGRRLVNLIVVALDFSDDQRQELREVLHRNNTAPIILTVSL